jgi:hypothetical protein
MNLGHIRPYFNMNIAAEPTAVGAVALIGVSSSKARSRVPTKPSWTGGASV